ncbi:MAG TPA: MlaD family protein [Puia sp.]|jgi:ABC-type transporter Mla subunit MlaD|nr:MlaD family protein [Puia sp.]
MRKWTSLVFSLTIASALPGCNFPTGKYTIHVVFDDLESANVQTQVRLYGDEVGEIQKCILLQPHQLLVDLTISKDVRIDRCDSIIYHETLIGDPYIQLARGRRLSVPGRQANDSTR